MNHQVIVRRLLVVSTVAALSAQAQESEPEAELAKQLVNPVASLISVPFQGNMDFGIGPDDASRFTLSSESTSDWTGDQWLVSLNFTISQLFRIGGQPLQAFVGGRYYLETPKGGPEWGLRFGITLLFPK